MNLIQFISSQVSSFPVSLSGSLNTNTTNKKILGVVLVAFAFLSACYFLCRHSFFKTKEVKQNQKIPLPQPQVQPDLINVDKQAKNDKANQGADSFQLEPETEDESVIKKEKDDKEAQPAFSPQLEVPQNQPAVEKEKDEAPASVISSWDELESFCHADERKDLKALEIPGQGIVSRKHVARLLEHKPQLPDWNSLQEQSMKLADGEIKLSGLTKAALCLNNLDFRDFFQDINDNKVDLTSLSTLEWNELVNARLPVSQAVIFLQCSVVQQYACLHKPLQSLLNRKDRLFSLPTTQERLQIIKQILVITQTAQLPTLNLACKDYFTRALTLPETDCAAFYQLIQHDPILVNAFFDAVDKACEGWGMPADQKQAIGQKLLTILSQLEEDKKLIYFDRFLKSCHHEELSICRHFKEFLAKLTDQDEQDLAQLIAKQVENPGKLGRQWIDSLDRDKKKDNINRILKTIIPALNNIQSLKEIIGKRNYIEDQVLKHLTFDQCKMIIQDWQTNLSSNEAFKQMTRLISDLYHLKKTDIIEQILQEFPTIKLKKLLTHFKDEHIAPYIGALYALNSLNSDQANGEKEAKILIALAHMNSLAGGGGGYQDDHRVFARFLAEKCSYEQAGLVIKGFQAYSSRGTPQRLGESFLTTLLESEDLDKIRVAFNCYWQFWKRFNNFTCGCSARILPFIKSEEVLKTVYQAIPSHLSHDDKIEIHQILRKPFAYNNFGRMEDYRVGLDQSVINRIVV